MEPPKKSGPPRRAGPGGPSRPTRPGQGPGQRPGAPGAGKPVFGKPTYGKPAAGKPDYKRPRFKKPGSGVTSPANPHPARAAATADGKTEPQRIAKMLARAGVASRREVERMIEEGRVSLDGVVVDTPATLLASLRGVTVDGVAMAAPAPTRMFLFHKPSGFLTTERDPAGRPTIYDRLPADLPRVIPIGRLDMTTEGLLL
ncbi:MAG: S4 domain-containing protein, partial [bacterium]|nr:S4 domain-containing protein [bacterium]